MTYFLLLVLSIVLHELGHFAVAKCFGVRVKRFCIFFDWGFHLFSTGKRFATELRIGWLPIGGYVKFDIPDGDEQPKWSIMAQRPWKRLLVAVAGVTVNLLVAYCCIFARERTYIVPERSYSNTYVMKRAAEETVSRMDECRKMLLTAYLPKTLTKNISIENVNVTHQVVQQPVQHYTAYTLSPPIVVETPMYQNLLWQMADINLLLLLFNLLPFAPLDGAHCLFSLYEMVFRRPLNEKVKIVLCLCGLLVVVGMMAVDVITMVGRVI